MSKVAKISLAEMLSDLRAELIQAQGEGAGKDVRFRIDDIELEVAMTTSKKANAKGGVKFWVYNAEAGVSGDEGTAHKLKLKLKAGGPDGKGEVVINAKGGRPK